MQATVLAVGQSLIFYLYAAGYYFGAFLVVENRAVYDNIFRYVCKDCWCSCSLSCVSFFFLSVFAAVVFTALSIGRASSFAPDASKAQVSAGKIIALLNRKSQIDAYSSEGVKLVSDYIVYTIVVDIQSFPLVIVGEAIRRYCCQLCPL